jgi:hypothetical protein
MQRWFDEATVFVNTSDYEGFPNTFVQAATGGCGILSLRVNPDGFLDRFGCGASAGGDWERFCALAAEAGAMGPVWAEGAARFLAEWHDNRANVDALLEGLANA